MAHKCAGCAVHIFEEDAVVLTEGGDILCKGPFSAMLETRGCGDVFLEEFPNEGKVVDHLEDVHEDHRRMGGDLR